MNKEECTHLAFNVDFLHVLEGFGKMYYEIIKFFLASSVFFSLF